MPETPQRSGQDHDGLLHRPAITPALAAEEWAVAMRRGDFAYLAETEDVSDHARAALYLYGQPFGFDDEDVEDEREAYTYAVYLARMAQDRGDEAEREKHRERAARHFFRAQKISALLPPA